MPINSKRNVAVKVIIRNTVSSFPGREFVLGTIFKVIHPIRIFNINNSSFHAQECSNMSLIISREKSHTIFSRSG